jgi:hypothetical protein
MAMTPEKPLKSATIGFSRTAAQFPNRLRLALAHQFCLLSALQKLIDCSADEPRDREVLFHRDFLQLLDLLRLEPYRREFLPHVPQCIALYL